ncbi:hypothetical protein SAMN02910276_00038 [Butyrivibrio sp. Su6]|uniref:hypothetical protein n=1 Tax=Butyrivibrio sp. Su6 TaxID=1520810 RepID=UPI00089EBDA8|nr:hypothetical protein [Butyrivibrio sp. Su6]SEF39307.1 hypothetical protein SAMN02910276_00038 [Butyrivibrio sp. Su6]
MGLDSRLNTDIRNLKRIIEQKNADTTDEIDLDEETYMYADKKPMEFINEGEGVFDIKKQTGINSKKSVFDRTALFKTNNGDD